MEAGGGAGTGGGRGAAGAEAGRERVGHTLGSALVSTFAAEHEEKNTNAEEFGCSHLSYAAVCFRRALSVFVCIAILQFISRGLFTFRIWTSFAWLMHKRLSLR